MRKHRRFAGLLLFFLLVFSCSTALQEEASSAFQVQVQGNISCFKENPILIYAPKAGMVRIEIKDEYNTSRAWEEAVQAGEQTIIWDGLGWNGEPMLKKEYVLHAVLTAVDGTEYQAETTCNVSSSNQALLYALPSAEEAWLEEPDEWFLEFRMIRDDKLVLRFEPQDEDGTEIVSRNAASGARCNRLKLSALKEVKNLKAGKYTVSAWVAENPAYSFTFNLTVHDGKKEKQAVFVTEDIMPSEGASDEEIWQKMMLPSVVVDLKPLSHQHVYSQPDTSSSSLGTLHGQSQAVQVFEIQGSWARIGAWNHEKAVYIEGWVPLNRLKVETPSKEYGLLLDKKNQTLTLFQEGKRVATLLVSTGRPDKNKLYQETAAGSFLTGYHLSDYSTNGLKYDFVIRYDGGNMMHQIPYAWGGTKKDLLAGEVYLGSKASHACVRVQAKPGEAGINAYWLWTHLPYRTRMIILDDPEERSALLSIVTGSTPRLTLDENEGASYLDKNGQQWVVQQEEEETAEDLLTLTFGGDAVLGIRESYAKLDNSLTAMLREYGMAYPFQQLQSIFQEDDCTSVNLECVLKDNAEGENLTKRWRFRGNTENVDILTSASVEIVNIANNHTIDYGEEGFQSTLEALQGNVAYCGYGNNTVMKIGGHLIGFGGCRETVYLQDPEIIDRDLAELREAGAEYIVYQCHWGTEYDENHNALQEAMARRCWRNGANLVIGHHPHVVQGVDFIGEMPVIYSLGNLMFGGTIRLTTYDGMLAQAIIHFTHSGEVRTDIRLIPILTSSKAANRVNDYQPVIATGDDRTRILQQVQKDTGFSLLERILLD